MKIETKSYEVPIFEYKEDENGEIIEEINTGKTETLTETHIYAEENCLLRNKKTGKAVSNHIQLGSLYSIEDYEDVIIQ